MIVYILQFFYCDSEPTVSGNEWLFGWKQRVGKFILCLHRGSSIEEHFTVGNRTVISPVNSHISVLLYRCINCQREYQLSVVIHIFKAPCTCTKNPNHQSRISTCVRIWS